MEVDEIHIFGENGKIIGSSIKDTIGYDIDYGKQSQEFLPLLNSEDDFDYYIQDIQKNSLYGNEMKYIAVNPLTENKKGFIQIGLIPQRIISYREQNSIKSVFEKIPIRKGVAISILDLNTGELLGSSNEGVKIIEEDWCEVFQKLDGYEGEKILLAGDKQYYTFSKKYSEYIIIGLVENISLYKDIKWHIFSIVLCMLIICSLGIIILYKVINKNVILDIEEIHNVLNKIQKGDFNVRLDEKGCLEIAEMKKSINKIIIFLLKSSNRFLLKINNYSNSENFTIGLFEYISELNLFLVTNNTRKILGISKQEWDTMQDDNNKFKQLLNEIKQNPLKNNDNIFILNNKYMQLSYFEQSDDYFWFIQDVTKEITERDSIIIKSKIDLLTGLLNKGTITDIITECVKNGQDFGVLILFDLDNFKRVNDTKGHPEGDRLLKLFAETIKGLFRAEDFIGRFGGDEFAVFINKQMSKQDLEEKMELVINSIRQALTYYYNEFNVSVSIGTAQISKNCNTFEKLYELADSRLYKAKKSGKDNYFIE